jgi:hypothetical protein
MFVAYGAPESRHRHTQVRFLHHRARPHATQQIVPGYERPGMFNKHHEDIECPRRKRDGMVVAEE